MARRPDAGRADHARQTARDVRQRLRALPAVPRDEAGWSGPANAGDRGARRVHRGGTGHAQDVHSLRTPDSGSAQRLGGQDGDRPVAGSSSAGPLDAGLGRWRGQPLAEWSIARSGQCRGAGFGRGSAGGGIVDGGGQAMPGISRRRGQPLVRVSRWQGSGNVGTQRLVRVSLRPGSAVGGGQPCAGDQSMARISLRSRTFSTCRRSWPRLRTRPSMAITA